MLIVVFCEFGGKNLLSKSREIADLSGDRVSAFISQGNINPQQLIYFGADQVEVCNVQERTDWINIIASYLEENNVKCALFPSNTLSNIIMGEVYSRERGRIASYFDEANLLEGTYSAKSLKALGVALRRNFDSEKCHLVSLKVSSLPEPFEDTSRHGNIHSRQMIPQTSSYQISSQIQESAPSSSSKLTVLIGSGIGDKTSELCAQLAEQYGGTFIKFSGSVETIYGPCVAVEVGSRLSDLPVFNDELISISSKKLPICSIADTATIHEDVDGILKGLLK